MDLYRIVDLRTVWIIAHVAEKDISQIQLGTPVDIQIPQLNNKNYKGKISLIYPMVDSESRNLKVRIELPNPKYELKPGMFANINIVKKFSDNILSIPYSSAIQTGKRNIIFVHKGNGIIEPREVEIGITDGDT